MVEKSKVNTQANEILKTQIDASIGIARSVVQSWLPDPKPGDKMDDDEDQEALFNKFSTGRPDRLGLGAKYLSHNEAMRLNNDTTSATRTPTKQQLQLKNKILNQNQRLSSKKQEGNNDHKRSREIINDEEEESSDNEYNKNSSRNKKAKNKIGKQGDFLSMYLNERSDKKKKSKGK